MIYKTKRFNTPTDQEKDHSLLKTGAKAAGVLGGAFLGGRLMRPVSGMVANGVMAMSKNPLKAIGAGVLTGATGMVAGGYAGKKLGDKLLGENQKNNQNQ